MTQVIPRLFRERIRQAQRSASWLQWGVLAVLLAAGVAFTLVAAFLGKQTWDGVLLNLGTDLIGAVATYVLLQRVIEGRAKQEEQRARRQEEKEALIVQMGSDVRDVAVPAANELRRRAWLTDGSLIRANLRGADLSGADLALANLSGAILLLANLSEAILVGANLSGATLFNTNLSGAILLLANLSEAILVGANLSRANLSGANMIGANLRGANLREATVTLEQLEQAASLKGAIMPDGTKHE